MAQPRGHVGRLRKHAEGWDSAYKRIFILNETFEQWRQLKANKGFRNDDTVAQYLMDCYASPESSQFERDKGRDKCSSGDTQHFIRPESGIFQSNELL